MCNQVNQVHWSKCASELAFDLEPDRHNKVCLDKPRGNFVLLVSMGSY